MFDDVLGKENLSSMKTDTRVLERNKGADDGWMALDGMMIHACPACAPGWFE